jgi:hypothetical protein
MAASPRYRIHPAIGVARVGNADPDDFYLGPERPSQAVTGDAVVGTRTPPFKSGGLIKRQAVRFRVFEYVDKGGVWTMSREVNLEAKDVVELTWTVHVANRKASFFTFAGLAGSPLLPKQPARERRNKGVPDRRTLEIDPLPRSISGINTKPVGLDKGGSGNPKRELWPSPPPVPAITSLGQLRTDLRGRLVFVPGAGVCAARGGAPITDYANNNGWFDDVCDGPVTAHLKIRVDGKPVTVDVEPAWVLVGPPDFAPDLPQQVTLYDVLLDLAVRKNLVPPKDELYSTGALRSMAGLAKDLGGGATKLTSYKVDFDDDVAPILRGALASRWDFGKAQNAHGSMDPSAVWGYLSDPAQPDVLRKVIFSYLRKPGTRGPSSPGDMPRLLGDDPYDKYKTGLIGLSLTVTQYAIIERWAANDFLATSLGYQSIATPPVVAGITPGGLDRAALEHASGGAFFPGIEVGWSIREPGIFAAPLRIKPGAGSRYVGDKKGTVVAAGYFSRQMALPWLADFLQCQAEEQALSSPKVRWGWWPSQRPNDAYPTAAAAKARSGAMLAWTRAQVGAVTDWPSAVDGPGRRPPEMPSYSQMVANWWKFGFVTLAAGADGAAAETERAASIP